MSQDKDEIIAMAREAGAVFDPQWGIASNVGTATFERFATLCRADLVAENAALKQAHEINADTLNAMQVEIDDWKARALKAEQAGEPVAWAYKGPLGYAFSEKQNEAYSIPLYCAPMTHDSDFIQIPVAYQYAYPDGMWRCSYGDEINGSRPITSRSLYARKDGK